jgi:putative NADH-flavin reductase
MKTTTIALFGGTGRTGEPFIKHALKKFRIKALVRDASKISFSDPDLEIIQGDILNPTDVEKTIAGSQLVVSLIGHVKGSPANLQTQATQYILDSMKKHEIKRILSLTGGGVRDKQVDKPRLMDNFIVFAMKNMAGKEARLTLLDGIDHADILKQSGTDWTIVRGPMLTQDPSKGKIEVGNVGMVKGIKLTREDLAIFMVNELENNQYIHKMPFLTNGK